MDIIQCLLISFNPRSHEGSDPLYPHIQLLDYVSIHAPTKGATPGSWDTKQKQRFQSTLPRRERRAADKFIDQPVGVSIHAPAKGATHETRVCAPSLGFQSTLPRRERHRAVSVSFRAVRVSIHAPAKGATLFYPVSMVVIYKFQSTLPRRERPTVSNRDSGYYLGFQSTLPRRERRIRISHILNWDAVSIHAPAKGATFE